MQECMEHIGEYQSEKASKDMTMPLSDHLGMQCRCSHCYDQKEAFGKKAFSKVTYIECSKDGYNQQNTLCKESGTSSRSPNVQSMQSALCTHSSTIIFLHVGVPGYPTWIIKGKQYPGEQTLEELEEIVQQASNEVSQ